MERIEYDPNRSSKIALVRWIEGAPPVKGKSLKSTVENPPEKFPESSKVNSDGGKFSFFTLPGGVNESRFGRVIGRSLDGLKGLPRVSVAGAKPSFFTSRRKEDSDDREFPLSEIKEWRPDRQIWIHRLKRKAAISWQSVRGHSTKASSSPNFNPGLYSDYRVP